MSNLGPQRLVLIHRRLLERGGSLRSASGAVLALAPADDQLRELIAVSRDIGVEVLAYSPLAFGVLGCAPESEERRPVTWLRQRLFQRLLPASLELRSAMQAIAVERAYRLSCFELVQSPWHNANPGAANPHRPGMWPLHCNGQCRRRSFSG